MGWWASGKYNLSEARQAVYNQRIRLAENCRGRLRGNPRFLVGEARLLRLRKNAGLWFREGHGFIRAV
jgi:hypothetical protein